ncbi:MAG: hypothetical protein IH596_01150 [Bacteroidales bacterium]|nr:hypothetical protein [Bacteroidales bacterium]
MSRYGLLAAFLFLFSCLISGQHKEPFNIVDKPLRIEIPVQSDKETHRIIPCGKAGMILFYKSVEVTTDFSTLWYFTYYDRNLQKIWVKSAPILSSLEYKDIDIRGDTLYLCFEADKKNRNRDVNFQILHIALPSGSFVLNNGKIPDQGVILSFEVVGRKAFIGLNNEEEKSSLLLMDLPTGQTNIIPLMPEDKSALLHCSASPDGTNLTLLVSKILTKRTAELYLCKFRSDGTKEFEVKISTNTLTNEFTNITEISPSESETLIIGSYSANPGTKKATEEESTGLVTVSFVSVVQKSIEYYNFLDLKNIKQLLSEKDVLSLRKKSIKKSRADQEYSLDFSLLLHQIIPWKGQLIVAAEAYHPQYHTESFTDYDFYGRPYTNTYSVFDGYRFTGIILAAFDKDGKMVWDNAMSIKNLLSFNLEPKINLYLTGNEIVLTYLSEGKIACRIIRESETVEKTTFSEMELNSTNDKLLNETRSRMVHWYEDYFLCYGYQEIRDISKGGNDKRLVYFCNKVKFDR